MHYELSWDRELCWIELLIMLGLKSALRIWAVYEILSVDGTMNSMRIMISVEIVECVVICDMAKPMTAGWIVVE